MSVFGNDPGPYSAKGRRQCIQHMHQDCRKLMAMVSEWPVSYDRALALQALDGIQDRLRRVAAMSEMAREWEIAKKVPA